MYRKKLEKAWSLINYLLKSFQIKYNNLPSRGTASDVGGDISERMVKKKQMESSTVISINVEYYFCKANSLCISEYKNIGYITK